LQGFDERLKNAAKECERSNIRSTPGVKLPSYDLAQFLEGQSVDIGP
jgi:hypothetical protein